MVEPTDSTSPPRAQRESNLYLRIALLVTFTVQLVLMTVSWAVYTLFLIAVASFAPGHELAYTVFIAAITVVVTVSMGTTTREIVLLFSNSQPAGTPSLLASTMVSGLWMVLPIIYLVWLVRDRYVVPFVGEIAGVAAACLIFLFTLASSTWRLYQNQYPAEVIEDAEANDEERSSLLG